MMATQAPRRDSDMLGAALGYLDDEWSVFPVCTPGSTPGHCQQGHRDSQGHHRRTCAHPGKTPLVRWGVYQDRLPDVSEVRKWWHDWPTANIGLATGVTSGVVVIDLDGEIARAEAARRGYDDGPWVRTGRVGGQHLYCAYRENAPTIFAKVGGIDFRGQGGYVLLPPSLHASGARYTWGEMVHAGEPLPVLPRWIDEMARTTEEGAPRERIDFGRLVSDGVSEGARDQELFRAAAKLRGADVPFDVATEVIQIVAAKCQPPFDQDEAAHKVESAYGRYSPNVSESNSHHRMTGAELATARFEPPRWAIPGILPAGLTILAGRPKLGKSWLGLGWSLSITRDVPVMGKIQSTPGEVLYLALEDGLRRMQERIALMLGDAQWPAEITVETEWRKLDQGGLLDLELYLIEKPNTRMVVVDTFKRIRPEEKGPRRLYDFDYDAVAPVAALARRQNVAIVLVFHVRKGESDDPVDMVSGTLGLSGAADGVIVLRRERGHADASLFITGRDVEEQELALKWEKEDVLAWNMIGMASQFRTSQARQEILDVLEALGQARPAEIADALGKNRGAVRHLLFSMTRDGELRCRESFYSLPVTQNNGNVTNQVLPSDSTTVSNVTAVSRVSGVSDNSKKPTCRVCGGELPEHLVRIGLHMDCQEDLRR